MSAPVPAPLLDVALDCIRRGWYVFPCWPRSKKPMLTNGWHGASNSEDQISGWWGRNPDANVAIACNPSNLAVVDIDHGIRDKTDATVLLQTLGLAGTYAVRTGCRPELGYTEGAVPDVGCGRPQAARARSSLWRVRHGRRFGPSQQRRAVRGARIVAVEADPRRCGSCARSGAKRSRTTANPSRATAMSD